MKLKDLIAVCDSKHITIAIAPSYFKKNKALYDLAEKTRRSDAYGTFYREGDYSNGSEGYITAVLTKDTPLLDHNKFLHLYKDKSLMETFADMTVDHMEPTQYAYDQEAIRVTLNY
jgi:hypothetical protein